MKIAYAAIVGSLALILSVWTFFLREKRDVARRALIECYVFAVFLMLANVCIVMAGSITIAKIFYTLFFTAFDFFLYFYMLFCVRYSKFRVKLVQYLILGVAVLDFFQFMLNFWTGHIFTVSYLNDYYIYQSTGWFIAHLVFCYTMIVFGFLLLQIEIHRTPGFFKAQYIFIIVIFIVASVPDFVYLYMGAHVNWAVVLFPFTALGAYYFVYYISPYLLKSRTIRSVTDTMESGLLILDYRGNLVYQNRFFEKNFHGEAEARAMEIICMWKKNNDLKNMDNGVDDFEVPMASDHLHIRLQFHKIMSQSDKYLGCYFLIQDMTDDVRRMEEEHYRASYDELTGVYKRATFFEQADRFRKEHPEINYVIVVSDIMNFKSINDMFGTDDADFVLKQFGYFLSKMGRSRDVYGRVDGDRFAIMLPEEYFKEELFVGVADSIMNSLDKQMAAMFKCYIGVYNLHEDISSREMTDRAFMALKSIKGTQKRVGYYTKEMSEKLVQEQSLMVDLKRAMESDEIQFYIQPQVNSKGIIEGGEALVRWIKKDGRIISPGVFIPFAEECGMITELDRIVWDKAACLLSEWCRTGLDYYLSVNISVKDIFVLDIYEEFTNLVRKYDIPPSRIRIEITESAVMKNISTTENLILRLHEAGFIVEMDDFGSAYSSLNMLKSISVDIIKLDMAFLRKSDYPEKSRKIIKGVVAMAKDLELGIVTEGVETKEQFEFLDSIGCGIYQGYYFAKPMPVTDFTAKIGK